MKDDKQKQEDIKETNGTEGPEVLKEFEDLQKQLEEFEEKYKRALADYQNLQKRVMEEKGEWIRSANRDLLLRLLPVLDTLMMAEKHLQSSSEDLRDKGLEVSINHFLDTVKAEGITRIKTVGEVFDPFTMECVVTEDGEENKVIEELRAGYMLYDKVLRAAQVKVGKS